MRKILKEKITWYDVVNPDDADLKVLEDVFRLHPVLIEELKNLSSRSKAEFHDRLIYIVTHFPYFEATKQTNRPVEIDILLGRDAVATVRYEDFPPLEDFANKCETMPGLTTHCLGDTPAHFIYRLFEHLFDYAQRELRHVNEKISAVEEGIFRGQEKEMIRKISYAKRDILDFLRIIRPLGGILESLQIKGTALYGKSLDIYFTDLVGDYERVWNIGESYRSTIESLEDTNQALLSSRIDEVMRILSVMAFLLAPFSVIGALFQINTRSTPIIGLPADWWIIFALMTGGSLFLYFYFKKKRWL